MRGGMVQKLLAPALRVERGCGCNGLPHWHECLYAELGPPGRIVSGAYELPDDASLILHINCTLVQLPRASSLACPNGASCELRCVQRTIMESPRPWPIRRTSSAGFWVWTPFPSKWELPLLQCC